MGEESTAGTPRGPVATLRRIAFLMERQREETRRIEAFRKAARTILPLPEEEVRRRADEGTLTELPGIGPSTAAVITDACNGVVPEPTSADFLSANGLRGASTVRAALKDLVGKDLVYKTDIGWIVYDRLFAEYLRRDL